MSLTGFRPSDKVDDQPRNIFGGTTAFSQVAQSTWGRREGLVKKAPGAVEETLAAAEDAIAGKSAFGSAALAEQQKLAAHLNGIRSKDTEKLVSDGHLNNLQLVDDSRSSHRADRAMNNVLKNVDDRVATATGSTDTRVAETETRKPEPLTIAQAEPPTDSGGGWGIRRNTEVPEAA